MDKAILEAELKSARLQAYAAARGGWPVPLAGATYWGLAAFMGTKVSPENWSFYTAVLSGMIFPVAIFYGWIFRNRFMKVETPDQGVIYMAMGAMLLFWPTAFYAMGSANEITPIVLAIGMSTHWPVFGWSYGRPVPFIGHVVIRTIAVLVIAQALPDDRFTLLPAAVAAVYLLTVIWLYLDSGWIKRRLKAHKS